jgi:hypothetical protein
MAGDFEIPEGYKLYDHNREENVSAEYITDPEEWGCGWDDYFEKVRAARKRKNPPPTGQYLFMEMIFEDARRFGIRPYLEFPDAKRTWAKEVIKRRFKRDQQCILKQGIFLIRQALYFYRVKGFLEPYEPDPYRLHLKRIVWRAVHEGLSELDRKGILAETAGNDSKS